MIKYSYHFLISGREYVVTPKKQSKSYQNALNTLASDIFPGEMAASVTQNTHSTIDRLRTTKPLAIQIQRQYRFASYRTRSVSIDFTKNRVSWYRFRLTNDIVVNRDASHWTGRVSKFKHVPWPRFTPTNWKVRENDISISVVHINNLYIEKRETRLLFTTLNGMVE